MIVGWDFFCTFAPVKKRLFIFSVMVAASMAMMWASDVVPDTLVLDNVSVTAIKQGTDIDLAT